MSPCTDPTANAPTAPHNGFEKETTTTTTTTTTTPLCRNQQKRSSSWSHSHFRQPPNSFFLSRRAAEQKSLVRDKRRQRKSVTVDDTPNSFDTRGDLGLVATSVPLHLIGNPKEAGGREFRCGIGGDLSQHINTAGTHIGDPGTEGKGKIGAGAKESFSPSPIGKITFCIDDHPSPPLTIAQQAPVKDPARSSAQLVGLPLVNFGKRETGRRRAMRTVSHDDYLLARGANPRTGMVTPSVHSGSSLIDDPNLFRNRGVHETAKWRLKGDQWVSLGLEEPSPLPSPAFELNEPRGGRQLRTPPKLVHGRPPHYEPRLDSFEQNRSDSGTVASYDATQLFRIRQRNERQFSSSTGDRNDAQVHTFPAILLHNDRGRSEDSVIKRKPLGTPPRKQSADRLPCTTDLAQTSTETVIMKKGPEEQIRSSSMPTPRKMRAFRPEDVGKALPALPGSKPAEQRNLKGESRRPEETFLGLRQGNGMEEASNHSKCAGQDIEERLPCRPMNNIRFRSPRSEGASAKRLPATANLVHTDKLENQQRREKSQAHIEAKAPGLLCSVPTMPPKRYRVPPLPHRDQRTVQHTLMSKTHVPPYLPSQPQEQVRSADRDKQMTTRSTGAEARSNAPVSPSTITPIITPTITAQPSPEDRLMNSSWREIPSPLRSGRDRAKTASRPAMPGRAEGTHSVPQVSPQEIVTDRYPSRMTGTSDSEVPAISTSVEGSPERELIPRPLKPSKGDTSVRATGRKVAAGSATGVSPPAKTCLHCHNNPSSDARPHNTHGSTHTQENQLAENTDPRGANLGSTSDLVLDIPRDHSGCCPECCVVGCHGGCLGHRTAFAGGAGSGLAGSFGVMKQAFRNSVRLSRKIRLRTSAGGSCETEAEEVAELETPMSWEMSGPISLGMPHKTDPSNFWGGSDAKEGLHGKRVASGSQAVPPPQM